MSGIAQNAILDETFQKHQLNNINNFIVDGVCRTLGGAKYVHDNMNIVMCIDLNISENNIIDRVKGRRIHKKSGRTYHVLHNPPRVPGIDDITGEKLKRRSNDTPEGIRKRMVVHNSEAMSVLNFFQQNGISVLSIDAMKPILEITDFIERAYQNITGISF